MAGPVLAERRPAPAVARLGRSRAAEEDRMSTDAIDLTLPSGLSANVLKKGRGAPLVFLHSHLGRTWDATLDALAERYTVYAPQHPGSTNEAELMQLDAFS